MHYLLFGPFDISVNQHFMQACLDDSGDETAVITSYSLITKSANGMVDMVKTSLNAFRVHLVILFGFRPI